MSFCASPLGKAFHEVGIDSGLISNPGQKLEQSAVHTPGLNRGLLSRSFRLFRPRRDHFGLAGRNFAQKSRRDGLGFLRLRVVGGDTLIHINVAVGAGFAALARVQFSGQRSSHCNLL